MEIHDAAFLACVPTGLSSANVPEGVWALSSKPVETCDSPMATRKPNLGFSSLINGGMQIRALTIFRNIASPSKVPISAWNFKSTNIQKMTPAIMVVAVKMIASPVVCRARRLAMS